MFIGIILFTAFLAYSSLVRLCKAFQNASFSSLQVLPNKLDKIFLCGLVSLDLLHSREEIALI